MPWTRNLGGSRVQFELAEHFVELGHTVEKFDNVDATPLWLRRLSKQGPLARLYRLIAPKFTSSAKRKVLSSRDRFDVIDAHQGNLPYSKALLAFQGAMICRSVGLLHLYSKFDDEAPMPTFHSKRLLPLLVAQLERRRQLSVFDAETSFQHADAILLPNPTEASLVSEMRSCAGKGHVVPFGLPPSCLAALRASSNESSRPPCIASIGTWERRKGSSDWPSIARQVRRKLPNARFCLLGTGCTEAHVKSKFAPEDRDWVDVVPSYSSENLPILLTSASTGAFASYLEGFGYGVLEMIAAGLPVVSYDIPGPSTIISPGITGELVPTGNVEAMSAELVRLLNRTRQKTVEDSVNCVTHASKFNIPDIAAHTLEIYRSALAG